MCAKRLRCWGDVRRRVRCCLLLPCWLLLLARPLRAVPSTCTLHLLSPKLLGLAILLGVQLLLLP